MNLDQDKQSFQPKLNVVCPERIMLGRMKRQSGRKKELEKSTIKI